MDTIRFILENQITIEDLNDITSVLSDYDQFIRDLSMYVLEGNAGNGDERRDLLGIFYDDTQAKITETYNIAKDVWAGKYGNGDEHRRSLIGDDYDLVRYWVNSMASVYVPDNLTYTKELNGKRYALKDVPTSKGKITWYGFGQRNQGDNPYVFFNSGCGFMSFMSVIATITGYAGTPLEYANKYLKSVTNAIKCPISIWAGTKLLDNEGIKYTWVKGALNTKDTYDDILSHLKRGNPVIVSLSKDNRAGKEDKRYTNYAHYSLLIGVTDGGNAYMLDPGAKLPRYVNLYDVCDHIPGTKASPDWSPNWNGWVNAGGYIKVNL